MSNQKSYTISDLTEMTDKLIAETQQMDISPTELSQRDRLPEVLKEHRSLAREVGIILARTASSGESQHHKDALVLPFIEMIRARLSNERKAGSWIHWYPICYLFNLAGFSAVAGENYRMLAALFHAPIEDEGDRMCLLEAVARYLGRLQSEGVLVQGYRHSGIERSSHFLGVLRPMLAESGISMNDDISRRFFDRYEALQVAVLYQLVGTEYYETFRGRFAMAQETQNGVKVNPFFLELMEECKRLGEDCPLLKEGLFKHGTENTCNLLDELSRKPPVR